VTLRTLERRGVLLCLVAGAVSWWLLTGVARAVAPVNIGLPSISGTAQQGATLTEVGGTWSPTPASVTIQWVACTPTCGPIAGATGPTYVVQPGDVGHTIEVEETASDGLTPPATATATSLPTATVIALPPANTVPPKIAGTPQIGKVLTLTKGQWTNAPTIADQWQDCTGATCTAISGQTGTTYTVTAADIGHTIRVLETATNSGGSAPAPVPSNALGPVVAPPSEVSAPSITGLAQQGSVLTEQHGTWTGNPTSFSYQWWRCTTACTAIGGATAQTYTLTATDVGASILVAETAINAGGPSAPANSAVTAVVTTPAGTVPVPTIVSLPTASGPAQQGQTLVEAHGTWNGNPSSYRYQWESCNGQGCAAIPGATSQTYTPTAGDVGQTIAVLETAINAGGSSAPAASVHTATVSATSAASLTISPLSPLTNQTVTLVATVNSSSGNADPSGSVTFFNGFTPIHGCTNQNFKATSPSITLICQASFAAGTASLTAVYTPTAGSPIQGSASPLSTLNVAKDSTSTSLAVTKQVLRRKRATYTATIVLPVSNSGPIEPTGRVRFFDGGRPIRGCENRPLSRLAATCTVRYRSLGGHKISARYAGDSNFAPSASPSRLVRIVRRTSGPPVEGFINSTLEWQFHYHPRFTQVTVLRADGLIPGMIVLMTCRGGGCPFSRLSIPTQTATSMNLLSVFRKRHLRVRAQITLRLTRPHWIGKYYSFTVRAGQGPLIVLSCLGVGRARPGVGC
jgi:hypothetical protein